MAKYKSLLLTGTLLPITSVLAQQAKPNIIYIMCDDLGYADIGCYGQQYISTPNLDRMAKEGMRFTQAYAGSPVSAPSRASLMTGQHTGHTHVRGNKEYRIGNVRIGKTDEPKQTGQEPYDTAHIIIPEIMKDQGYTTGIFGKWAGGYEGSVSTPQTRGVDEFYGFICQFQAHAYFPNFLNAYSKNLGDTAVRRVLLENNINYNLYGDEYKQRKDYSADLVHQAALKWISTQNGEKPFCGFLTYTLPHAELYQPQDSIFQAYKGRFCNDKSWRGDKASRYIETENVRAQFAAMVTRLDSYVGEILALLKAKGLDKNTLVIFTSDNGPHEEGGADPAFFNHDGILRGTKRSTHEGGIRVPFIAYWPETIPAGVENNTQIAFYDVMPTFCELIGVKDYEKRYANKRLKNDFFDGISFAPTLLGKGEQKKHDFLYFEFHETDMMGVRMGNWKLVVKKGQCSLYDLATDPHEDYDIASKYPKVVQKMKEIIKKEHIDSPIFKVTLPQ